VVADDLTPLQRHGRDLAEIALGLVAVRSASGAASERATNELGHGVTRWMITLTRFEQSARALGDPSAALPVATAFLGSQQPSKDDVYANFASVTLFGNQVLDQFAPGTGPPVGAERKLGRAREALTIAAINQWLRPSRTWPRSARRRCRRGSCVETGWLPPGGAPRVQ
jgi:hypothetical protein